MSLCCCHCCFWHSTDFYNYFIAVIQEYFNCISIIGIESITIEMRAGLCRAMRR
jgi:hypothetical protein